MINLGIKAYFYQFFVIFDTEDEIFLNIIKLVYYS